MPSVYKKRNRWGIDYSYDGKRYREVVANNKATAQAILNKRLTQIAENRYLDKRNVEKVRFFDFIEDYTQLHLKPNRPTWWKSEKHNLRHLKNYFGNCYLDDIRAMDVERFKIEHLKMVSKSSVNKALGCLKAILNKAIEWEKLEGVNPVSKVKMYKLDNKRTRYLEEEEIERLLSNCEGYLKDIVEFAIDTGMRKSEIFNLKWRDVDLKNRVIHLLKTKNGEQRQVPITNTVEDILYRVKKNPNSPYVFVSFNGKPFKDIKKSFHTALRKSQIEDFRFHDLRHTCASILAMGGVNLYAIKNLLGHKDIKMTMRYAHLSLDYKKQAVKVLDRLKFKKNSPNNRSINEDDFSDLVSNEQRANREKLGV